MNITSEEVQLNAKSVGVFTTTNSNFTLNGSRVLTTLDLDPLTNDTATLQTSYATNTTSMSNNTPIIIAWTPILPNSFLTLEPDTSLHVSRMCCYSIDLTFNDPTQNSAWSIEILENNVVVDQDHWHTPAPPVPGTPLAHKATFHFMNGVISTPLITFRLSGKRDSGAGSLNNGSILLKVLCSREYVL
jgi:hypothetical protein